MLSINQNTESFIIETKNINNEFIYLINNFYQSLSPISDIIWFNSLQDKDTDTIIDLPQISNVYNFISLLTKSKPVDFLEEKIYIKKEPYDENFVNSNYNAIISFDLTQSFFNVFLIDRETGEKSEAIELNRNTLLVYNARKFRLETDMSMYQIMFFKQS